MPRRSRKRRPRRAELDAGKRTTRTFSWTALAVIAVLSAGLLLLPIARRLDPSRFAPSVVDTPGALRAPATDPDRGPERAPNALPPCPAHRAWHPGAEREEAPRAPHDEPAAGDAEHLVDAATNSARSAQGLPELAFDETLRAVARLHSEDMATRDFFSHDAPDGRSPSDRVHDGHRTLVGESGENIWMCRGCWKGDAGATADTVVNSESGWMHSPGHRANILRDAFTHTAVGIAQHESDLWATQLFAQKRGELFGEVPGIARVGDCLLVEMTPYPPDAPDALGFELLRLSDEQAVGSPTPLGMSRLDVPAGRYRLRFHVPLSARRYSIVSGPSLEVQ